MLQEGGVDHADDGFVVDDEADGDAVEGREVGEVDRACEKSEYLLFDVGGGF